VSRPKLEVADIFRDHGAAWRSANAGHVSLDQLKVMSAIERCRTVALGGHVERCEKCSHTIVAYNSCRNADSGARRPLIPTESGHPIRRKATTDSDRRRPPC
jgi:hypothetical protein